MRILNNGLAKNRKRSALSFGRHCRVPTHCRRRRRVCVPCALFLSSREIGEWRAHEISWKWFMEIGQTICNHRIILGSARFTHFLPPRQPRWPSIAWNGKTTHRIDAMNNFPSCQSRFSFHLNLMQREMNAKNHFTFSCRGTFYCVCYRWRNSLFLCKMSRFGTRVAANEPQWTTFSPNKKFLHRLLQARQSFEHLQMHRIPFDWYWCQLKLHMQFCFSQNYFNWSVRCMAARTVSVGRVLREN